jgi:low temperature requirement protein LtrA
VLETSRSGSVWWAWMGFTWYATAFDNDDVARGHALHTLVGRVSLRFAALTALVLLALTIYETLSAYVPRR